VNKLRLKDLGRWYSGGTPPRERLEHWDGDVPWISAKDIDSTRLRSATTFITHEAALAHSRMVPAGALLMIVRGMALAHGLPVVETDMPVAFNQDLRALVCAPGIAPRFVYYSLIGHRWRLNAHVDQAAHGTARVNDSIYGERIPVPDRREQRAVADFLDRECRRIDELSDHQRMLRADCHEFWLSILHRQVGEMRAPRRPLHVLVDSSRPVMYGIVLPGEPVDDGVLLVKGRNVERGELQPADLVRVARGIEAGYARARLRGGDLLVTIRGSYGAVAEVPKATEGANITQDTARVAPGPNMSGRYLLHALRSPDAQAQISSRATGAGVKGLNIRDLRRVEIPAPDLARQQESARVLDEHQSSIDRLLREADQLTLGLTEYRDALINEAVTGKLDVARLSEAQMEESLATFHEGGQSEILAS